MSYLLCLAFIIAIVVLILLVILLFVFLVFVGFCCFGGWFEAFALYSFHTALGGGETSFFGDETGRRFVSRAGRSS